MQRVTATLARAAKPAVVAGAGAASTSTSQCRAPQKTPLEQPSSVPSSKLERNVSVEEGLDGWGYVQLQTPFSKDEVAQALEDCAVLGGLRSRGPTPPASVAPHPHVVEAASDDESCTSDGSEANRMLSRADTVDVTYVADTYYEESCDPMENLSSVIGNLLNNPTVVSAIQQELVRDPAFYQLMRQVNPGLPPTARPLLITDITSEDETDDGATQAAVLRLGGKGRRVPLHALLASLGEGICALAGRLGEAFAHLGSFLRRLGDNLRTSLEGLGEARRGGAGAEEAVFLGCAQSKWESALVKVACAVAVVVFARRMRALA